MGNNDTKKIKLREMQKYEWYADIRPSKKIKKYKKKERQAAKKEIDKARRNK